MDSITFEEFSRLPKKSIDKLKLVPGRNYFIQETRGSPKIVYKGTFSGKNDEREMNIFDNVEYVVNPHRNVGKPHGFSYRRGHKFMEVMEPTSRERSNKNKTINELNQFISEQKIIPTDIIPTISFIGEDYRTAKDRFNLTKTRRSTSRSSGRGNKKRKTAKKRRHYKKK
jgi:hypothetical protein